MSNIPQKRRNPFDRPLGAEKEEVKVVEEVVEEEQPRVREVREKPAKVVAQQNDQRDKYTATMDQELRRKIKVYCATNGIMFSEFIEIACREKLRREGIK